MSPRTSVLRRAALALMAHAGNILPSELSHWSEAMASELQHIESDAEALRWALGCVLASYVERSRLAVRLHHWFVRWLLTLAISLEVLDMLFASILTAAYRLHYIGLAEFLGGLAPGDDYHRFIPLIDATPWWIHGLWVAAAVLFAVSAWPLIQDRPVAFPLFATAWILGAAGNLLNERLPDSPE